ncbi:hypothetical protein DWS23_13520 [Escherichia coli]|nr:hypothetical protein [Escherichia coli]EFA4952609.1 hypothetical protein [Escherichia coli]EFN9757619.1 hypothetical protein [Escherichia coli]EFO1475855.1 hypothetical protein [Escherichia coli]EFO1593284.1 hypothetical protein [Escherichia coli]
MSVPVYQIMGKGCHRRDKNMSFSPLFVKIFCRSSGSLANPHVDNFVHKLFTSLLIYSHAFYSIIFIVYFHEVKNIPSMNN